MNPAVAFLLFLAVTLLFLGGALFSGFKARRSLHLSLVAGALVSLGVTIYFAEKLGELYDLETAGAMTPIHIFLAKLATVFYLVPLLTGILTIRNRGHLRLHRSAAFAVLTLTTLAAVTGIAMVCMSERLPS